MGVLDCVGIALNVEEILETPRDVKANQLNSWVKN
jgi:hypothetical protein